MSSLHILLIYEQTVVWSVSEMWSCCCLLVVLVVPVLGQFSERYVHAECGSVKVSAHTMIN